MMNLMKDAQQIDPYFSSKRTTTTTITITIVIIITIGNA